MTTKTVMQLLVACWQAIIRTCRTLLDLWIALMTRLQVSLLCEPVSVCFRSKRLLAFMFKPVYALLYILNTIDIFHSQNST